MDDIISVLDELCEEEWKKARQTHSLMLIYEGDFKLSDAYKALADKWIGHQVVFCVGLVAGCGLAVYLNRKGHKCLPTALGIGDRTDTIKAPKFYRFKNFRTGAIEQSLVTVFATMTETTSDMKISTPRVGNFSFDQFMDIVKKLDFRQVLVMKGRATATPWKKRNEYELGFLRCWKSLMEIRELDLKKQGTGFNAYNPPFDIIPLNKMVKLETQKGTRMKEVDMTTESFNLLDLFNKELLNKHGIVILGPSATTGFGKTQFALRLAVEYAKAYNQVAGLPQEDAVVVFTNTLDVAREVAFKPGYVWVIDEMNPSDQQQTVHVSENMMKVLMAPTVQGSIRGRNNDIVLPRGVPRIFTGNAENAQQWCGHRVKWTEPLQRKAIVFEITQPIVPASWRNADSHEDDDAKEVARTLREGVGSTYQEAPAESSLIGRLFGVVRGAVFGSRA